MGANAGTAVPTYASGEVLTAANLNLTNSGTPVFADSSARDGAFGSGKKVLAEGQLCYLEDSNVTQYYDGSNWQTLGPTTSPGLVRVGGGTLSGASTAFTNVFSATYDAYKIVISDAATSGNAAITLIFGATTSGYYYSTPMSAFSDGNYSTAGGAGSNAASWAYVAAANAATVGTTLEIVNPYLASRTFFSSTPVVSGSNTAFGTGGGFLNNTTSYTGFTLAASTGNLTGTCNIYGYALS
jgi:hypothetical protein